MYFQRENEIKCGITIMLSRLKQVTGNYALKIQIGKVVTTAHLNIICDRYMSEYQCILMLSYGTVDELKLVYV